VLTSGINAILSVFLFAILSGCMSGVNMMLICIVPRFFKKGGKVSSVSGILNACTYVGSALSTYGIAILAEGSGWTTTLLILFILAASATLLTLISAFPWNKIFGNNMAE
jgi:OPA family glycerol-3-phosphate transporter-like MFS transporter